MTDQTIDPNTDPVLLGALSDRMLAERVLALSRATAGRIGADWTETSPSASMLNAVVPLMAAHLGAEITALERMGANGLGQATPAEVVTSAGRTILDAHLGETRMPDGPVFVDPATGNPVAMLLDRYAASHGVHRTSDRDGWTKPGQSGLTSAAGLVPCVSGDDAVGLDPLAVHMIAAHRAAGRHAVPYWSPGHTVEQGRSGRLSGILTPESILRLDAEDAVAGRLHALPAPVAAGVVLEHARDMRSRHGLSGGSGPHGFVLEHAVPVMAALHGHRLLPGEGDYFRSNSPANDQEAVGTLSSRIMKGIVEGRSYLIDLPMRRGAPVEIAIADRVLLRDAVAGNSAAIMLDGVARDLGAARGGRGDPLAEALSGAVTGGEWSPAMRERSAVPRPASPAVRAAAMASIASARAR